MGQTLRGGGGAVEKRNVLSGVLFGIGLAAFVDEVIFHQLLQWHHFYDLSTTTVGIVSDGILHAFSWFATIAALFLLADLRRRDALVWRRWWGGALVGSGGFQLYDGVVHHKLLGVHQIRYVDDVLIYDLVWNAVAGSLILVGVVLLTRTRTRAVTAHA
jgi:uncharacterized membrane protein